MRLPFLRSLRSPRSNPSADQPAPRRGRAAAAATTTIDDSAVQTARTRARRRLVGALVLLVIAIVGFPLLFETQPRPLPVDTPMEVARHPDGTVRQGAIQPVTQQPEPPVPPPAMPPPDAGNEVETAAPAMPASAAAALASAARTATPASAARPLKAATKPGPAVSQQAPAADTPPKQPSVVVSTLPSPKSAATAPPPAAAPTPAPVAASGAARYVVQVGAFNDAAKLNDARSKVEKLGLKTYTQPVDTPTGRRTRVRAGPFATREEADGAAAKIKRSGLPANIVVL